MVAICWIGCAWGQAPDGTATSPSAGPDVQLSSEAFRIGRLLRCPVCVSESVGDSSSAIAVEMRTQIEEWLAEGYQEAEILGFFQERYGDWILLEPPRRGVHLWVWWLPGVVLAAGATMLVTLMVRWIRASRAVDASGAPSAEERARIDAALRDGTPADGPA